VTGGGIKRARRRNESEKKIRQDVDIRMRERAKGKE
jgi:hypothetical protein